MVNQYRWCIFGRRSFICARGGDKEKDHKHHKQERENERAREKTDDHSGYAIMMVSQLKRKNKTKKGASTV